METRAAGEVVSEIEVYVYVLYLKVMFIVFVYLVCDVTVIFQELSRIDINDVGITNGSVIKSL